MLFHLNHFFFPRCFVLSTLTSLTIIHITNSFITFYTIPFIALLSPLFTYSSIHNHQHHFLCNSTTFSTPFSINSSSSLSSSPHTDHHLPLSMHSSTHQHLDLIHTSSLAFRRARHEPPVFGKMNRRVCVRFGGAVVAALLVSRARRRSSVICRVLRRFCFT